MWLPVAIVDSQISYPMSSAILVLCSSKQLHVATVVLNRCTVCHSSYDRIFMFLYKGYHGLVHMRSTFDPKYMGNPLRIIGRIMGIATLATLTF